MKKVPPESGTRPMLMKAGTNVASSEAIRPFHVYQPDINPAIKAEFAHAVYRFGHSMLDDTVARTNEDPVTGEKSDNSLPLLDAFLKRVRSEMRRFNTMGDSTWCKGKVTRKYVKDGYALVDLEIWGENQRGELTTPGMATVALPSRDVRNDTCGRWSEQDVFRCLEWIYDGITLPTALPRPEPVRREPVAASS